MSSFRDEILKIALEQKKEHAKNREESQLKKIKRWQAFRNQYETVALQLKDLDGLKLEPRKNEAGATVDRVLSVRRIESLPAEPVGEDRVYPIEMFIVQSDGSEHFKMGWIIHWRTWDNDNKVKRSYADDDACWRCLHDDALWRSCGVIGETAKYLKNYVDLTEYEVQQRGMDL
jgi:hypothetical protein